VPVIETRQLVKQYGAITALKGVSLTVRRGEIFGLLGQNGAGKTTLVKILLGLTSTTGGQAFLLDQPAGTTHVRKHVGYLPEDHRFPDYHSAYSLLSYYAALYEVPRAGLRQRIDAILGRVGLRQRMHDKIRTYSKGMKQRLGIAQALFHDPEMIFFDEPTDGVDPVGRREIRDMMLALKAEGRTIFLNSHLLGEVEQVCDRVAILRKGEVLREGDVATLTRPRGQFVIGLAPGQELPREEIVSLGYNVTRAGPMWEIEMEEGQTIDPVVDLIRERGLNLRRLSEKRQTLEELFLELVAEEEKKP
jgi:ABC-2 type transport system ATP-binding protein